MKKTSVKRLSLSRETLRRLEDSSMEEDLLLAAKGGAWPETTVKPYPCQASCLC